MELTQDLLEAFVERLNRDDSGNRDGFLYSLSHFTREIYTPRRLKVEEADRLLNSFIDGPEKLEALRKLPNVNWDSAQPPVELDWWGILGRQIDLPALRTIFRKHKPDKLPSTQDLEEFIKVDLPIGQLRDEQHRKELALRARKFIRTCGYPDFADTRTNNRDEWCRFRRETQARFKRTVNDLKSGRRLSTQEHWERRTHRVFDEWAQKKGISHQKAFLKKFGNWGDHNLDRKCPYLSRLPSIEDFIETKPFAQKRVKPDSLQKHDLD